MDEVELALEDLANRFEMAGNVTWSGVEVADVLRRYAVNRDAPLTNRDDDMQGS
jgi:hypothetical protein